MKKEMQLALLWIHVVDRNRTHRPQYMHCRRVSVSFNWSVQNPQ